MRRIVSATLLFAVAVSGCDRLQAKRATAAHKLRDAAVERAKQEGKGVFLWFAAADSEFCDMMDRFHADPGVAKLLGERLVFVKVDVLDVEGGLELYYEMGHDRGVPAFAILDEDGIILADSGSLDQPSNIGFPTTEDELDRYEVALKTGCPKLTDGDLQLLRTKLQEVYQASESATNGSEPMPQSP